MRSDDAVRCLIRRDGIVTELPRDRFQDIDQLRQDEGVLVWLQLRDPGADELTLLADEFDIHELALEDVQKRGQRPKLDAYPDQQMLVVYEGIQGDDPHDDGTDAMPFTLNELHAFGGRRWIVTVQWADSPAVDIAARHVARTNAPVSVGSVIYALFDAAVDSYFPILDAQSDRMDRLEDTILAGTDDPGELREILGIKRQLLELRRVLAPMRDAANALLRREAPFDDDAGVPYFQDLYDHLVRVIDQLDLYRDLLASILEARLTVASNALNSVMKRLTAITVILVAPTLIAGIYGMNFDHMPELEWRLGYPYALILMLAVMGGAYLYFRRRGWF